MGLAKEKPLYDPPTDYEDDDYLWLYEQIELLRLTRFGELALPNLIEELEDMGREQRRALESSYRLLLAHLLMAIPETDAFGVLGDNNRSRAGSYSRAREV